MEKKLKNYIVDGKESNINDISLVDAPAIEKDFVYFSKENIETKKVVLLESDEKFTIVGPVLRPDFKIYRYDEETDYEYFITFTKEAVSELAHEHLKYCKNNYFSTDHRDSTNVYLMESWVIENESDKAYSVYGLDCPIGSWVIMAKVVDTETWQRIKNGELNGFSIEGWLGFETVYDEYFEKIKEKENIGMTKEEKKGFLDEIKEIIKETFNALNAPVQSGDEVAPEVEEEVEATEVKMEEEQVVEDEVKNEEEVVEEVKEEALEETVAEEVKEEETVVEDTEKVAMAATITEQQAEIEKLKAEIEKLSKQPSVKPENGNGAGRGDVMEMLRSLEMSRPH